MNKKTLVWGICVASLFASSSCSSPYHLTGIERSRILIDSRYDATPDADAAKFIAPYKQKVDSIMSPVVGRSARYMAASRPESILSNLLSDILLEESSRFNEKPDFAVYNMGGIRGAFPEGDITYGDVVEVAPFENKICFLTLTGANVVQLFSEMASRGGECVSKGVELVISKGKVADLKLNGKAIDPNASYRVATLDYLAQGNDGLTAFKTGTNVVAPKEDKNNVRYLIVDYFESMKAKGKVVDSSIQGRIKVID